MTAACCFSFGHASLHDRPLPACSPWELKGDVTSSHSQCCELTTTWILSHHPANLLLTDSKSFSNLGLIMASKWIPKLTWSRPPSASLSHTIAASKMHLQPRPITASKCISDYHNFSLQAHLQTHLIMASKCITEFTWSYPPNVAQNSLDHGIQLYLWVHSIVIFRRTSNCSPAPPAASPDIPCVDG
jgi:hypothetical protein